MRTLLSTESEHTCTLTCMIRKKIFNIQEPVPRRRVHELGPVQRENRHELGLAQRKTRHELGVHRDIIYINLALYREKGHELSTSERENIY
jgi:hypothetical protein